jgi:hypothetical protein
MFTKLNSGLNFSLDESLLETIPTVLHQYNTQQPVRSEPFWMEFQKPKDTTIDDLGHGHGSISFTRHLDKIFPDLVDQVYDYFKTISSEWPWYRERIQLLRTSGYILPHQDEPTARRTTINIGLKNSNYAETKFSNINSLTDTNNTTNFIMEDGDAYLLDVHSIHSVHPIKPCNHRYLITYSMLTPYDKIKQVFVR